MPDDLAAALAEAKRVADTLQFACMMPGKTPDFTFCGGPAAEAYWNYFTPARISSLLAAIEAVLELADDWAAESDELDDLAEKPGTDEEGRPIMQGQALAYNSCAGDLREAITRELTGKEAGGETAAT